LGKYILQLSRIPKLLKNVKEGSTVIRWCAAYALTEIIKNNPKTRKQLIPLFEEISKTE
jgi:methyl coenzyme M reductase alpha subunit